MIIFDKNLYEKIELSAQPGGRGIPLPGCVRVGQKLTLFLRAPRAAGIFAPELELTDGDDGSVKVIPFERTDYADILSEEYSAVIPTDTESLFFARISYMSAHGKRYMENKLEESDVFQITVYENEYKAPEWFAGGSMYHIFVDRFFRAGDERCKDGAFYAQSVKDCPQYPEYPGAPLKNNMFFGGDIPGIIKKLDYLQGLGITTLYLSPIFEAASNHKYDTGDYMKVDDMFGGDKALKELISELKKRGMHLILDGVFNHTGDDSRYFNKYGSYDTTGAWQSPDSPYADWYLFTPERDKYGCWWGIDILPTTNKESSGYREFVFGKNGVIERYLKLGIDGWRLDVADELPDDFLAHLTDRAKKAKRDALILGEVWEDASNKIAYSVRRRYFRCGQLDSVMNYPWRNAVIDFVMQGDGAGFKKSVMTLCNHYPKDVLDCLMNFLGTHDTERILTVLGGQSTEGFTNEQLSCKKMSDDTRCAALRRLRVAYTLTATLPGVPCIYYGDEAGMEGYKDPFNRRYYPWGEEDTYLREFFRQIGKIRAENSDFAHSDIEFIRADEDLVVYRRGKVTVAVSRSEETKTIPGLSGMKDLVTGTVFDETLNGVTGVILKNE